MDKSTQGWDAATKRIVALVLLLFLALIVYRFRAVWPPLILAFLMAFILDPAVDFLEARTRLSRAAATALVFVLVVLILLAAPAVAVPPLVRAVRSLNLDFKYIAAELERWMAQPIVIVGQEIELQSVYLELRQTLQSFLSAVAAGTVDAVLGFASTLFWLVFILLSAFYMVKDADRIESWLDSLAPLSLRGDFVRLRKQITDVWNAFLRGQLLMAVFLTVITTVVATIVGLPNALALGLLAGAMEFVPNLGPIIAAIPAVLLAFFQGSAWLPISNLWFAVLVLGLYLVIQQIEGNVLLPRILGESLNLHPLVVLVAVIAGGSLAGVLGVLLAAPSVATLRVLGEYFYRRLSDQPPFSEEDQSEEKRPWLGQRLWTQARRRMLAKQWEVRPARADDWSDVEAICAQIWDGNDYVPRVWEEWLADPEGELTVVERKGRVVALGKLTKLGHDEWWLEGLRVDPAYRRLGVARRMQVGQLEVAERVGRGVLRFGTISHNKAVHRNAERGGFFRTAVFQFYGADPLPGHCPSQRLALEDLDRAWNLIEASPILRAANGLYEVSWQWMNLTRERLRAHLHAGEVWGMVYDERLAAMAIVPCRGREDQKRLSIGYIDGDPEGITALSWCMRVLAHLNGHEGVRVRPLDYSPLLEALQAAGITRDWENDLWIFERPLGSEDEDKLDEEALDTIEAAVIESEDETSNEVERERV